MTFGLLVPRETPPSPAAKPFDLPGIGVTAAFLVGCVVAIGGALVALLTRKGYAPAR